MLGLTGYKEHQIRHWRYYTAHGAKLLSPVRDPEELQQWLEVEQFSKSLQQWHEADVNIEGDLVPAKVLAVFRELVEKAIISCRLTGESTVEHAKNLPPLSVCMCVFSSTSYNKRLWLPTPLLMLLQNLLTPKVMQ